MAKRSYIHPRVVENAMDVLKAAKAADPREQLVLFKTARNENDETRAAYTRAAQRLGWNVVRSKGHVYENGKFIW